MNTRVAVGFVFAALCACVTPQGGTTGGSSSSSSSGAESTSEDPPPDTDPIQTVTSETDTNPTSSSTTDLTSSSTTASTGDSSTGEACPGIIDALAQKLSGPRCSLLLAFDSEAAIVGWHSVCGEVPASDVYDEKSALEAASCCADGGFLNVDVIESPFVVYLPPLAPTDGGVAIVSNHLGAVVFEGSIGADAPGTISIPDPLSPASALADTGGCAGAGFSFMDLVSYHAGLGTIPADLEASLADTIKGTLLPAAMAQAGVVVDRSVLLGYEDHDGAASSYIVLLELSVG